MSVFIAETLIYAITFPLYLRFSKKQVILYIQKASQHQKNIMIRYTVTSFILIIAYNNTMVGAASMVKKLLVYLLLIYFVILTYRLLVSYLKADDDKQELNELARTDRLTGLGNRLALNDYMEKLLLQNEVFYLLFLDLNNFKSINDHYGHTAGEEYLRKFAAALKECIGSDNICFRFSGDEFICLTKNKRLCSKIRDLKVRNLGEIDFLGVSAGMAAYPEDGRTVNELIKFADECMYQEKVKLNMAKRKVSFNYENPLFAAKDLQAHGPHCESPRLGNVIPVIAASKVQTVFLPPDGGICAVCTL